MRPLCILFFLGTIIPGCSPKISASMKDSIAFDGNQIYFETTGQGPPLVFVHGGGVDQGMWHKQVEYFQKRYRVITYDLRGHGQSDFSSNTHPDSKDLEILLDSLNLPSVNLVGLSLGAIIAVDFTLAHPERINKLVLLSPGLAGVQEQEESYLKAVMSIGKALQGSDLQGAVQAVLDMTFNAVADADPEIVSYVKKAAERYFSSDNYSRLPQLAEPMPLGKLPSIQQPTLLISGDRDLDYMKKNVETLLKNIPNANWIEVPGAGHLVNWEMQPAVNNAIRDFLKK